MALEARLARSTGLCFFVAATMYFLDRLEAIETSEGLWQGIGIVVLSLGVVFAAAWLLVVALRLTRSRGGSSR